MMNNHNKSILVLALVIAVGTIVFVQQQNATNQTNSSSSGSTYNYANEALGKLDTTHTDSGPALVFVQQNATNQTSMYNNTTA